MNATICVVITAVDDLANTEFSLQITADHRPDDQRSTRTVGVIPRFYITSRSHLGDGGKRVHRGVRKVASRRHNYTQCQPVPLGGHSGALRCHPKRF